MRTSSKQFCLTVMALSVFCVTDAFAQRYRVLPGPRDRNRTSRPTTPTQSAASSKTTNTIVSVELIAGTAGVGFQAQQWQQIFQKMGVTVQIRSGNINDKPEVTESQTGAFRRVKVVGELDRQGRIVLPDRVFSRAQADNLQKYLDDLKKFGKQGNPAGQALWGLNADQFGALFKAFSEKVTKPAKDRTLKQALEDLEIPEEYAVRMSLDANKWLISEYASLPKSRQSLDGFSRGTALAMLLNDYGLGFQPTRTPAGKIEIHVEPLTKTTEVWPVGWKLKDTRQKTAPALFKLVPIDLEDVPLVDVLNAISLKSKIPVRYDHYRIEANSLNLDTVRVNYPPRKTSFSLLIRGITNPNLLAYDLKIDELGQPFIWITTLKIGKLGK